MPVSTLAMLKERSRQSLNFDDKFYRRMLYFFELRVPAEVGFNGATDFLFPLILPPENYSMEEPFSAEVTPTLGGGLYVEENGIIQRIIRLSGHTGFQPRNLNLRSSSGTSGAFLSPEKRSYSRQLPFKIKGGISGQRHFQYLQDSIFRTYADLKRDPALAADTKLIFHNPRDEEHWVVIPKTFKLNRDGSNRFLYKYDIELIVVESAAQRDADFSDDKSIFDSIRDSIRAIKNAIDRITGMINDITALVGEITRFIKDVGKIIDAVTEIVNAASNFVNGVTTLIQAPYAALESTLEMVESAVNLITESVEMGGTAAEMPEKVQNKFRQMGDALEILGINPGDWETPAEATVRKIREQQEARQRLSRIDQAATTAPTSFEAVRNLGTQYSPGDAEVAESALEVSTPARTYQSARQVEITEGDTLVSLAARYLGDARLWQRLAILNGLRPPFLDQHAALPLVSGLAGYLTGAATGADEVPFDGVLGPGQKILIPSGQKSALDMPLLPVRGVTSDEPVENYFLGTDFALEVVSGTSDSSRAIYDIPIDVEGGSVDAKIVQGQDNLIQLLRTRILTERGSDQLYKQLGMRRVVALNFTPVDLETARFRVLEAISSDPRVANVESIEVQQNLDALDIDVSVAIRGLSESRTLTVRL